EFNKPDFEKRNVTIVTLLYICNGHYTSQYFTKSPVPFIYRLHRPSSLVFLAHCYLFAKDPMLTEFHRLLEQEIPRLRRYARALTRNSDRADDLVQETLTRAIAKAHLWQTGTDIRAWLFTIMHNQNVNAVGRAIRDGA